MTKVWRIKFWYPYAN